MFKRMFACMLGLLLVSTLLVSCAANPQTPGSSAPAPQTDSKVVKLAYIGPMTGDYSQYGTFAKRGFELVLNDRNHKAGDYTIELEYYDDANDPSQSVSMMNKIINDPDLLAILGPFASTNALAIAPLFKKPVLFTMQSHLPIPISQRLGNMFSADAISVPAKQPLWRIIWPKAV